MGKLRSGRPVPADTVRAECLAVVHASTVAEDGRLDEIRGYIEQIEAIEARIGRLTRERDKLQDMTCTA